MCSGHQSLYSNLPVNKHALVTKYVTEIFNFKTPKLKPSNVWYVDILLRYLYRLGDNTLLTNIILTETYCSGATARSTQTQLLEAPRLSTICMFTINNVTYGMSIKVLPNKVSVHSKKGQTTGKILILSLQGQKVVSQLALRST